MKNDRCIVNNSNKSKSLVKSVVYADESGFRDDGYRRYGYAPLGIPVFDLISSQRTGSLHLLPHVLKIPSLRHGI